MTLTTYQLITVPVAGNRQPITKYRLPAVATIGWHVARHCMDCRRRGELRSFIKMASTFKRL